jgi:pyrroline-5-carboxylate reductase
MALKVAFIGGGNMGEAILAALLNRKLSLSQEIAVSDAKAERREFLQKTYGVRVTASNIEAVCGVEVVLLAIKPQNLDEVMAELKGKLKPSQLVLSIIAGKRVATLVEGLAHQAVVRAMPNTPAQIGQGMTVWTATEDVMPAQRLNAESILMVMGQAVYAGREDYLDMATALSGSGPAYVFLFMEALTRAGVDIGLPEELARLLALQTVAGSAAFAKQSPKTLAELRIMVTSPGGTTAAALKVFEEGKYSQLIEQAVAAAYRRAQELGGLKPI